MASGLSRRKFLGAAGLLAARPDAFLRLPAGGVLVNDVHSQLNATRVADIVSIDSVETLRRALARARREGRSVAIAGGRHAMGGQQFGTGAVLLDMRPLHRILGLDREKGIVAVEAGIQWPELMRHLREMQSGVEVCYPQFPEFLRRKRLHDPDDRFQSDWYRHYRRMFGTGP